MTELEKAILLILDNRPEQDLDRMLKNMLYSVRHSNPDIQFPTDEEIRRPIPDAPGYEATSFGRIFSIKTKRYLKHFISNNGYAVVTLRKNNESPKFLVHRLIAIAFKEDGLSKHLEVNHLDGNKLNNHVNNLKMSTHSDNIRHSYIMGHR